MELNDCLTKEQVKLLKRIETEGDRYEGIELNPSDVQVLLAALTELQAIISCNQDGMP